MNYTVFKKNIYLFLELYCTIPPYNQLKTNNKQLIKIKKAPGAAMFFNFLGRIKNIYVRKLLLL